MDRERERLAAARMDAQSLAWIFAIPGPQLRGTPPHGRGPVRGDPEPGALSARFLTIIGTGGTLTWRERSSGPTLATKTKTSRGWGTP
jgi:hypothetical protein